MKAQHTPGPWNTRRVSNYSDPGNLIFWADTSKGGQHNRRLDVHGNFTEADATLIAAAPELLAALEGLADYFEERNGDNECRPLENARDAIAKARGEA